MSKELLLGYIHEYKFEHHTFLFYNILRIGRQHIFKQFIYLNLNAMQQYSIDEIWMILSREMHVLSTCEE